MSTTYSYFDAGGTRHYLDENEFLFLGPWSSTATYASSPFQAVRLGASTYLCVTSNTNKNPAVLPNITDPTRYWSPLVIVRPGSAPIPEADVALALAGSAYTIGTNAFNLAANASATANGAYAIATAGTAAAANAATTASQAYALAVTGTNAAAAALAHFSTAAAGTTAVWATSTENGVLTDTQLTFVGGLLTSKVKDSTVPTSTNELYSFVKFFNFDCPPTNANACFGTFVVDNLTQDCSWTNGNSKLYNRIGDQSVGGMGRILILDAPFESAGTIMSFPTGGPDIATFGFLSSPSPVTRLFAQGTYFMWNKDGAPPFDVIVSLRLDGIAFIGG